MADVLERASAWLENQRTRHNSHAVTYTRGSQSAEVPATIGKTTFELVDGYGVLVRHESRDFLVLATNLFLGAAPALPERGDQIRETQGNTVFVYEVMAPGKEPCWRYSDLYRKTLRIHTKQVEER
jgi:hypothetical protein